MPLDPQIERMLATLRAHGHRGMAAGTPQEGRAAFRLLTVDLRRPETIVPVAAVEELTVPGPAGPIPVRVYRPGGEGPHPTVVFYHGGGYVIGDLDTHDNQARTLCREIGAVVLSVGYRLAPEHPFPAGLEDCEAATRWAGEHAGALGGDGDRVAVAGDSAGGNLAAVVARRARDAGGPPLAAQLLIYPGTDHAGDYPSRTENAEGRFLTLADIRWFSDHYVGTADRADPDLSPVLATDLGGLPPAVVVTAQYDPLRDEGEAYADALERAGVPVALRRFDGLVHGFLDLAALSPAAAEAVRQTCAELRRLLTYAAAP